MEEGVADVVLEYDWCEELLHYTYIRVLYRCDVFFDTSIEKLRVIAEKRMVYIAHDSLRSSIRTEAAAAPVSFSPAGHGSSR